MEYLGIDAGGTKTEAILIQDLNSISQNGATSGKLKKKTFSAGNISDLTDQQLLSLIDQIIQGFKISNPENIFLLGGFAGIEFSGMMERTENAFQKKGFLPNQTQLMSDGELLLRALNNNGIILVAGTGSNCFGEHKLNSAQAGGWGFKIGDEGSCYWIGMQAIQSAILCFDKVFPETTLFPVVQRHFIDFFEQNLHMSDQAEACKKNFQEIKNFFYPQSLDHSIQRACVSSLAPKVFRAAAGKLLPEDTFSIVKCSPDKRATTIIHNTANILAHTVGAVAEALQPEEALKLGLCGGLFRDPYADQFFFPEFKNHQRLKPYDFEYLTFGRNEGETHPILLALKNTFLSD